ncbi:aminotransferase [Earliella scabrosa]|nr:aminotransferase [Earliella scabrosa]
MSDDYYLLSTTRHDPQLLQSPWNTTANVGKPSACFLLAYHRDRLLDAVTVHNWPHPAGLTLLHLEALCESAMQHTEGSSGPEAAAGCYRIRILLSSTGALSVTASPIAPLPPQDPMAASLWLPSPSVPNPPSFNWDLLTLHLDIAPTPSSAFTRTKTTRRDHYSAARSRFKIPPPPTSSVHDVVLYNENGDVTETSIRNIAFIRREPPCWITPSAATGCLPGVVRRWLLEQGRIVEARPGELRRGDVLDGEYVLTFNGVEGCRLGRVSLSTV